jgi:putative ABC transport system substrate-binding protein
MKRRDVMILWGGAAVGWPLTARSHQASNVPRKRYLSLAPRASPRSEALREGPRELGHVENQNIAIEYHWGNGNLDRLRDAAADLVRLNVDVIVTGGPAATSVAKEATAAIPIVMAVDYDPAGAEFVRTLARHQA